MVAEGVSAGLKGAEGCILGSDVVAEGCIPRSTYTPPGFFLRGFLGGGGGVGGGGGAMGKGPFGGNGEYPWSGLVKAKSGAGTRHSDTIGFCDALDSRILDLVIVYTERSEGSERSEGPYPTGTDL